MKEPGSISHVAQGRKAALEQGWPLRKPRQMWDAPSADNPSSVVRADIPPTDFLTFGHAVDAFLGSLASGIVYTNPAPTRRK